MNRRRFLTISAGLALSSALLPGMARATRIAQWHGTALGAGATIALDYPRGAELAARAWAEIDRLESIFSLYRADSALSRLNRDGRLDAPPFELLDCLTLCGRVHEASGGRFDPTIQPLWAAYAQAWAAGHAPDAAMLRAARDVTGWQGVTVDGDAVRLRPGAALTLNGVAQGLIADRVAALLRAEGLSDVLVDTGEIAARGHTPEGEEWPVSLSDGTRLRLSDRALATSAPRGTVFDPAGQVGHILDPASGLPAPAVIEMVSLSAPNAATADALSTAACLMPDAGAVTHLIAQFPGVRAEAVRLVT
ncbi:MAG: FAD:protein FMN transferase [Paracoccus sp. (in: a-proteobacteria)]|nr:FAD:protein FMN transferase [Paracoccus sp. (in: a-proteobacteria)]